MLFSLHSLLLVMKKNILSIHLYAQCPLPCITAQPVNVLVCEGGTMSLYIQATGAASYQWYWSGTSGNTVPPISPWSGNMTNELKLSSTSNKYGRAVLGAGNECFLWDSYI
jgi:hypothetical protein